MATSSLFAFCEDFLPVCSLPFYFLQCLLQNRSFKCKEIHLTIFFMDCALGVVSKSHHQTQGHLDFLLCYRLRSLMLSHFTFSSVIHVELIFVKDLRSGCRLISFSCRCPVVQHHFLKRFISPLDCMCPSVKDQLTIYL